MLPAANAEILFFDAFSRTDLLPWVNVMGTWSIMGGVLQGSGPTANQYSFAFYDAPWTDYTVQGEIQIPAGSYGGGIGGRVNQATGAHYAAWVYPSPLNVLRLWKFAVWNNIGSEMMLQEYVLPADLGTDWHTLKMTFTGNQIQVFYDGGLKITATDDSNVSGGISADWWVVSSMTDPIAVDNILVTTPAPDCASIAPASAELGTTLDVTITGVDTSFAEGVTVASFSGTGITVNSTNVNSTTEAVANITIEPGATVGARDVTVTTGTEIVTCPTAFTITGAPVTTTTSSVEPTTTTTVQSTTTTGPLPDSDHDGIPDQDDECPASNLEATIIIAGCNSRVKNQLFSNGCTMSDEIAQCAIDAKNHGAFVRRVAHLTNDWKAQGIIKDKQKGAIQRCAAKAK